MFHSFVCFSDNPNVIKFPEDAPCSKEGLRRETIDTSIVFM